MPTIDVCGQDEVDTLAVGALLEEFNPRLLVIELVNGFGRASSAFKLGGAYSAASGAARWARFRLERCRPQAWQRRFLPDVHGRDALKRASVTLAKSRFPTVNFKKQGRTSDHDKADALLLALYGREVFGP